MDNLEQVITMKAVEEMRLRLLDRVDPRNWTADNRDTEFEAVRDTATEIVRDSVPLTMSLLSAQSGEHSFLYWTLLMQVTAQLIEYLEQARSGLDWLSDMERSESAVDGEWLTQRIRESVEVYKTAQEHVESVLNSARGDTAAVEEL